MPTTLTTPRCPLPTADQLRPICERFSVERLSVFGSYARDEARQDSDVDIVVRFEPDAEASLFTMSRLMTDLSSIFEGRRIDLGTEGGLHPRIKQRVMEDAVVLFDAEAAHAG